MGTIRQDVKVPASAEKLWDTFADLRKLPEWLTLHVKFKSEVPAPEDYYVGLKIAQVISMMGMPNTIEWTLDAYEPLRAVTISGTGMAGVQIRFTFGVEQRDGWTLGTLNADFSGQIIVGALGRAIEKEGLKQLETSLENLGDLLVQDGLLTVAEREQVELIAPTVTAD